MAEDNWIKRADRAIDEAFELTQLPQLVGKGAGYVGRGFDSLVGTNVAPVVEQVGRDLPRMVTESLLTIPAAMSGVGAPVAAATWMNRLRKIGQIAGYGSAAAGGYTDTDSPAGAVIAAGSLGLGNKLLLPANRGGVDVGGKAATSVRDWLDNALPDLPNTARDLSAPIPTLSPFRGALPAAARVGTDVAAVTALNEGTRQAQMSVGPNAVPLDDPSRDPFTPENIAANVVGGLPFGPQAVLGHMARERTSPKQKTQLLKWMETRADAEAAQAGYDWEGPISPVDYHNTFGKVPEYAKRTPEFREDYGEFLLPEAANVSVDRKNAVKLRTALRSQMDVFRDVSDRGDTVQADEVRARIRSILESGGLSDDGTAAVSALKQLEERVRTLPPETREDFDTFVQEFNILVDELNEGRKRAEVVLAQEEPVLPVVSDERSLAAFQVAKSRLEKIRQQKDELLSEQTRTPRTWHPSATRSQVVRQLQDEGHLPKITPEWLKTELSAQFSLSGDADFNFRVVLQKAVNLVLDQVPDALTKRRLAPARPMTTPDELSGKKPQQYAALDKEFNDFIDALRDLSTKAPDFYKNIEGRTAEIFRKKGIVDKNTGRLVNQESSWRKAIIAAARSYDPASQTIMVYSGKKYQRRPVTDLFLRDEHGEYIWKPKTQYVPVVEGGTPKTRIKGRTYVQESVEGLARPENAGTDLNKSPTDFPDDEAGLAAALAEEGAGMANVRQLGQQPASAEFEGTKVSDEPGIIGEVPEFLTPGKGGEVDLRAKIREIDTTLASLDDKQLYRMVQDIFVKDLNKGYRSSGGLRAAVEAVLENQDLANPDRLEIGSKGKKFLEAERARGISLVGKTEKEQLRHAFMRFFRDPAEKKWTFRAGKVLKKMADPKVRELVRNEGKPMAMAGDPLSPNSKDVVARTAEKMSGGVLARQEQGKLKRIGFRVPDEVFDHPDFDKTRFPVKTGILNEYELYQRKSFLPEEFASKIEEIDFGEPRKMVSDGKPLPPTARITIQEPVVSGEPRSGYQQVDMLDAEGNNAGSFSPDDLRSQGYSLPDLTGLKTGQYTVAELASRQTSTPTGDFVGDVTTALRKKFSQVLGEQGYAGTLRDYYTEIAVALAQQVQRVPVDFFSIKGPEWGLAASAEGRGKVGLKLDDVVSSDGVNILPHQTKYINRVLATLAHEISHVDSLILAGLVDAPDAFSERRRVHRENLDSLAQVLDEGERQAMIVTLKDALVPEMYQYHVKDQKTGKMYGTQDPEEFVATIYELISASLLKGQSRGMKSALEVLDYGPAEVREFANNTYRSLHDILDGMRKTVLDPTIREQAGKAELPLVDTFVTSEAFDAVVRAAREASLLRDSDKALAQARAYAASMAQGAASAPPLTDTGETARVTKQITDNFGDMGPDVRALPRGEEAVQLASDFIDKKGKSPYETGIWSRWFKPFAQLMFEMERQGAPLARPIANLAMDLQSGISRTRSKMLAPFLKPGPDGKFHWNEDNALVAKVSKEKYGPWRDAVDEVSAWQQESAITVKENGRDVVKLLPMFVEDGQGQVIVNPEHTKAQAAWDSIRSRLSPADQQIVAASSVSLDKTAQIAAQELVTSIDISNRQRVARLLMAMDRRMTYDQALGISDQVVGAYLRGNVSSLGGTGLSPQAIGQVDALLSGPNGLLAKFGEVQEKLLNRPGFRTESLPGDYVIRYRTSDQTIRYMSADSKHKANLLARKLIQEGNSLAGEIVHKNDLRDYTDFDSPDTILAKFAEVEGAVWDRFITQFQEKHGTELAEELRAGFTPGTQTLKELGVKGMGRFLTERKSQVDRTRYDYIEGTMAWVSRLATSMEYKSVRQMKDLILNDPRARSFQSFKDAVNPHFENLMSPTSPLAKELKTFATAFMMGGSLASAIMNGTQSLTTLVPVLIQLADKGGPVAAYKLLARSVSAATKVSLHSDWQPLATRAKSKNPGDWTLEESQAALYKRNVEDGGINQGVIIDDVFSPNDQRMMMLSKFGTGQPGGVTKGEMARSGIYLAGQLSLKPFIWVEQINSKVALMAGIEQGYSKGLRGDALYDHAKLVKTLATYGGGKANVPGLVPKLSTPYTRSAVGVVNTLQQYGYGAVATYGQLVKDALGKSQALSPQERRQAQKAFGTMFATQVAIGGALGLPFAAASLTLLEKLFGIPANQLVREGLASLGDDEQEGAVIAETALNGLGNQMFGIDLSSRLGVSNILGTSGYRGFNLDDMVGPTGSIVSNAAQALGWFGQGEEMKAVKALVPNSLKTLVELSDTKAKYGDLGIRDAGDNLLYTPTPSQAVMYALGFRPREVSQKRQAQKLLTFANERATTARGRNLDNASAQLLAGNPTEGLLLAQNARFADPTVDPRSILRSIVARAVDSVTEKDLLAAGPSVNEAERQRIADTFGSGIVNRQSEIQRAQLAAQLGARLGLPPDPKSFQRAAMVDSLVQARGMPRSQALRLVEFLQ